MLAKDQTRLGSPLRTFVHRGWAEEVSSIRPWGCSYRRFRRLLAAVARGGAYTFGDGKGSRTGSDRLTHRSIKQGTGLGCDPTVFAHPVMNGRSARPPRRS